jgi:diguanylate cyclase
MDLWSVHIPIPLALAVVAALGYLVGRRSWRPAASRSGRSQRELRRAQQVATELERIASEFRRSLSSHYASILRFRQRVDKLGDCQDEVAWRELRREAEEVLKPTLQLATQVADAYDQIRVQTAHLMSFTEVRTDPLTRLNNRRGLDDALSAQIALLCRYQTPFSLAVFAVDGPAAAEQCQGRLSADRMLQDLARLIGQFVREIDVACRCGGDEFVVVIPQTELAGAAGLAERLRAGVEQALPFTISGGVATALDGDTAESLLARAETALQAAASGGGNCVFRHDGERTEPILEAVPAETGA